MAKEMSCHLTLMAPTSEHQGMKLGNWQVEYKLAISDYEYC